MTSSCNSSFTSQGKSSWYTLDMRTNGAPGPVWTWWKRKKSLLLLGIELRLPSYTALSLVNIHISYGFYKLTDNMECNGRITASEEL
jgi:hypothetical protein